MEEFHFIELKAQQIEAFERLQQHVYDQLEHKEQLSTLSHGEIHNILAGNGMIVGVFTEKRLIAARALLVPDVDEDEHLGKDAGLSRDQLKEVIYQEISLVHPEYRGRRLQQQMGEWLNCRLKKEDQPYQYVCATVAPTNLPSMVDKLKQGMEIVALKEKYGGKLRYIFIKNIKNPSSSFYETTVDVWLDDHEKQKDLIRLGYKGVALKREKDTYKIVYRM
ncbi:GNAT family N-acetyltransferase [Alkalihalobacillus sp. LMS6]|uniref:GNAT family N-acetyltransferase n=1 Tax=Alkalihalobacillus sp. LMS6 TaxID=2924034 RepID=UPI0020D008F2|nr:GNAT family N-acetyltransferase [Alkalihalobacillus sp. LMS6]UTR07348.1 GNAT family N-acetyltransferase [Alkalihalobacillus sp. LMS6]